MNVLFLDQFSDTGGAQRCLLDLLPAVIARGWRASVAAAGRGSLQARVKALGLEYEELVCGPFHNGDKSGSDFLRFAWQTPLLITRIASLTREMRADLIYLNGPRLVPAALLAAGATPLLFHCHSRPTGIGATLVRKFLSLQRVAVVGSSRFVLDPLLPSTGAVVYNGVAGPCDAPGAKQYVAGVIGRIAPQKGQLQFVEAVRRLVRTHSRSRFLICGAPLFGDRDAAGYFEQVRESARGLPIDFRDWSEDVLKAMAEIELLVVPSVGPESTTRVIPEAFAAGLPVVAFATGGIPEVVRDRGTGWLVQPGDVDALAGGIAVAIETSPENRRAMSTAARREWQERFTLDRYRRDLLAIMEKAAASDRR